LNPTGDWAKNEGNTREEKDKSTTCAPIRKAKAKKSNCLKINPKRWFPMKK